MKKKNKRANSQEPSEIAKAIALAKTRMQNQPPKSEEEIQKTAIYIQRWLRRAQQRSGKQRKDEDQQKPNENGNQNLPLVNESNPLVDTKKEPMPEKDTWPEEEKMEVHDLLEDKITEEEEHRDLNQKEEEEKEKELEQEKTNEGESPKQASELKEEERKEKGETEQEKKEDGEKREEDLTEEEKEGERTEENEKDEKREGEREVEEEKDKEKKQKDEGTEGERGFTEKEFAQKPKELPDNEFRQVEKETQKEKEVTTGKEFQIAPRKGREEKPKKRKGNISSEHTKESSTDFGTLERKIRKRSKELEETPTGKVRTFSFLFFSFLFLFLFLF